MKIHDIVTRGAAQCALLPAILHGEDRITYGDLHVLSDKLCHLLKSNGLIGGHSLMFVGNSIEYAVGYFGISKAGAVPAPTPVSLPLNRLPSELEYCDADYVVTDAKHTEAVKQSARNVPDVRAVITLSNGGRDMELEWISSHVQAECSPLPATKNNDQVAVMISTSGTANDPKRVMLSHQNIFANIESFNEVAQLTKEDRAVIVLPMTAVGTHTTEFLAYLSVGMTIHIYKGIFVLGNFCRLLQERQITVANVTPFILMNMLSKASEVARKLTSIKKIFFASAPFAQDPFHQVISSFPNVGFYYGYGLTEAAPRCSTLLPEDQMNKMGSSGRALKNVEIKIIDDEGRSLPAGRLGEVVVKGPNVMLGYYKKSDLTAESIQDGYLRTGDCGYLDEDQFLYIRGRRKNIIITRGISVSPEEVEQELVGYPDIMEAYVAGYSDEQLGESIVAYVVARNNSIPDQGHLKEFLRSRLNAAKVPSRIEFVEKLQRNHNQKLIRG